jgi:hypothetical protein
VNPELNALIETAQRVYSTACELGFVTKRLQGPYGIDFKGLKRAELHNFRFIQKYSLLA